MRSAICQSTPPTNPIGMVELWCSTLMSGLIAFTVAVSSDAYSSSHSSRLRWKFTHTGSRQSTVRGGSPPTSSA